MNSSQFHPCFLCGSHEIERMDYLRRNTGHLRRDLAYGLPKSLSALLSAVSPRFESAYQPVAVNRRYFSRTAVYCRVCLTGRCEPGFDRQALADYYRDFYWSHRDSVDGRHVALEDRPNDEQLDRSRERIAWIGRYIAHVGTVLDFGAGDCAAAYLFQHEGRRMVHVVDPSDQARQLAGKYGLDHTPTPAGSPQVALVYSAHSIEHVHDLEEAFAELLAVVEPGGHLFFETPNIANDEIFGRLTHTPHTYMLSLRSFERIVERFPVDLVAGQACGPDWQVRGRSIVSNAPADLRVLLRKTASS